MRISDAAALLAPLLAVAACGQPPTDNRALARAEAGARAQADDEGRILCAQGAGPLVRACTVDRISGSDGLVLTLRHPDGAFHRLQVTADGRGVVAADGAEPAKVAIVDAGGIEVAIGGARYRLPATVKAAPPKP